MTFDEILEQAIEMLQRRGRVSYGALQRQFTLDDEYLADLKSELIEVLAVAADKDGKMLVWTGQASLASSVPSLESRIQKNQKAKIGFGNWELGSGPLPSESPNPKSPIPDPAAEAEACFLKALEIAQKQQAKSLELRAVMSLARLWRTQGKKTEAHQMLVEIYSWFTEGFETKDLQEAKGLLVELRQRTIEGSLHRLW